MIKVSIELDGDGKSISGISQLKNCILNVVIPLTVTRTTRKTQGTVACPLYQWLMERAKMLRDTNTAYLAMFVFVLICFFYHKVSETGLLPSSKRNAIRFGGSSTLS